MLSDRTLYKEPSDRIDPNTTLQNTPTTSEPKEEIIQTFPTDISTEGISNEPDERPGEPPESKKRLNTKDLKGLIVTM